MTNLLADLRCRSCHQLGLAPVLDLGVTPLANSLLTAEALKEPEATFPLAVAFCPACTLLQLTHSVPPETMFRDYLYFSSFSDAMLRHARELTTRIIPERNLTAASLALEIASNDGYLLQYYQQAGVNVLGVEPAENIARVAKQEKNIPTVCEFFGNELATRLRAEGHHADVVHANNVLAHVPDLNGFVRGIATILRPTGVAVIEAPYVGDMIDHCEFDTIYHEHLCYFSLTALDHLFRRQGLVIGRVERLPIHGGSLRIWAFPEATAAAPDKSVTDLLAAEARAGLDTLAYYGDFAARVQTLGQTLRAMLQGLKQEGKTIAAYGAAAKGSTLLNTFRIGTETLDFAVDRSTHKQGRFLPGVHVPIEAPTALLERSPDYVLLLTWNFADEILEQQAEYRRRGGKFLIPVPTPRLV